VAGTHAASCTPVPSANIYELGMCIGVNAPEGSPCDDGNPSSKHDQCVEGVCKDPTYRAAGIGDLKYATDVGPLAEGASSNPIVDRDGTVFAGVEGGVTAVDLCGAVLWSNLDLGSLRFSGATSLPGLWVLPVGSAIVDVDTQHGQVIRRLDLGGVFSTQTASTATSSVQVLDLALRASGAVVASLVRETRDASGTLSFEGMLAE